MTDREYIEKVLPLYLAGVVNEGFLECYSFRHFSFSDLDSGFNLGLEKGRGLARLAGSNSPELSLAIDGARDYADRDAGTGRNSELEIDFNKHKFLYGLLRGLELSTTIVAKRDTLGDVGRAFIAVRNRHSNLLFTQ